MMLRLTETVDCDGDGDGDDVGWVVCVPCGSRRGRLTDKFVGYYAKTLPMASYACSTLSYTKYMIS